MFPIYLVFGMLNESLERFYRKKYQTSVKFNQIVLPSSTIYRKALSLSEERCLEKIGQRYFPDFSKVSQVKDIFFLYVLSVSTELVLLNTL